MNLNIKSMVCLRCIIVVKTILEELDIRYKSVALGEIEFDHELSFDQRQRLKERLGSIGLEVIDDRKSILLEKIIHVIIEMVHFRDEPPKTKHSVYISEKLHYAYGYLSKVFSESLGIGIEQFIIAHRIEKAKELIAIRQLNLSQIAWKLHYCSVQHFSHQFKKVTGYSPSHFKRMEVKKVIPLEHLRLNNPQFAAGMMVGRA